jgi:acetolactate synthase-1/3 small subunit
MRHTLSILVENRYGELARIVGLFGARGFNIESLTVAETLDPAVSCVTLVTQGDDHVIAQIVKQLNKLVRVLQADDITQGPHIERAMMLVHLHAANGRALHKLLSMLSLHRLKLVEVLPDSLIVEATGDWSEMTEVVQSLAPLGIIALVRTGTVAISRHWRAHPAEARDSPVLAAVPEAEGLPPAPDQ